MQSSLPSQVKVALATAFIGAPANDNFRLPRRLVRDGWWLETGVTAASAISSVFKTGTHRHD